MARVPDIPKFEEMLFGIFPANFVEQVNSVKNTACKWSKINKDSNSRRLGIAAAAPANKDG